ncbi:MAG: Gfo/Idh/MocA family protein, partial [Candidatus Limnocylindria bacterium]
MRVAVIGAGSMGGKHAHLLAGTHGVDEVLVVDALPERAAAVAAEIGGRAVTQREALREAGAMVVATPVELHAAAVTAALERRIPVLCEKPLTEDLATSRALVEVVEAADAHVEVGFQRRHDRGYVVGRRQVADGSAGRIHLLRLTAFDPLVTPRPPSEWTPNEAAPLFLHSSI